MKKYIYTATILLMTIVLSCSDDDKFTTYCVDFDLRQCSGNPWLIDNQVPDTYEEHLALVTEYLKKQDIEVRHREIDLRPTIIVCQACFVCPVGPRFRVEISPEDTAAIYALNLLNVSTVECPDEF